MKKYLFLVLTFVGLNLMAQNRPESYNYQRGLEAVQNEKTEEALEYFNKDVKENPKNGYSYSWIAMLRNHTEEYGRALTAADLAIKYLPKKDVEYVIFAYSTRADVYLNLEDTIKAIADYTIAIKTDPEKTSLYEKRAQIYYEQMKYDLADADYQKMIDLELWVIWEKAEMLMHKRNGMKPLDILAMSQNWPATTHQPTHSGQNRI